MKSPLKKYVENLKSRQSQKPKVIREYFDEKRNCMVKVLSGPQEQPFTIIPTGWSD